MGWNCFLFGIGYWQGNTTIKNGQHFVNLMVQKAFIYGGCFLQCSRKHNPDATNGVYLIVINHGVTISVKKLEIAG